MPPALQSLLGLLIGLLTAAATCAAGYFHIPIPLAGWIAIFALLWIAIFLALKRNFAVLVVTAFLTGGLFSLIGLQLLTDRPHPTNPSSTSAPATAP